MYPDKQFADDTIQALKRYWLRNQKLITCLPIPMVVEHNREMQPPRVEMVEMPSWARNCCVNSGLLVPSRFILPGSSLVWERTDWFGVIHWYPQGMAERAYEAEHGPIHSYSSRLRGWDVRLWERAWVNRIGLFLRRWASVSSNIDETRLFGELPEPEIILTHDVDAIDKTPSIRIKQASFHGFNALRLLAQGKPHEALKKLRKACMFFVCRDSYWCFNDIIRIEEAASVRSHFLFYGGKGGWLRTPVEILMDPAYNVEGECFRKLLCSLHSRGWQIGLHASFNAWAKHLPISNERRRLERALGADVKSCRQHWLHFSWESTWSAQEQAGIETAYTLGFNDRPGFRNGAALDFHPLDGSLTRPLSIASFPMVLMDSHLYDYRHMDDEERRKEIRYWVDEIRAVRGIGSVIWHQHVFSNDYGWAQGYQYLIEYLLGSLQNERQEPKTRKEGY